MTLDSAAPKDDSADIVEYEDDFEPDDDDDGQLSLHNRNFSTSTLQITGDFYTSLDP